MVGESGFPDMSIGNRLVKPGSGHVLLLLLLLWSGVLLQVQNGLMTLNFDPREDSRVHPVNPDRSLQCMPVFFGDIDDHIPVAGDLWAVGALECKVALVRVFLL